VFGRRKALGLLGAGAVAAGRLSAADQPLHFTALDHVEISEPNSSLSAAFYSKVFGGQIWKNNQTQRRYVLLGPCYIAIERGREPFGVDHFSAGIEGFDIAGLHAYLEQRGIGYRDYPSGRDLNITDPDGIKIQLSADNTWSQLKGATASPETVTEARNRIFQPTGLNDILLNVSDPVRSTAFYQEIFGAPNQRNNDRIWFQAGRSRVGLLQSTAGQKPGVNHFCVSAAAFDYAAATQQLEEIKAKVETPEVAGAPEFRDLDGLLIQVMAR
jgi:catechol 2,3-dioxygenase-like lactoylglutathione lyase family enzyme